MTGHRFFLTTSAHPSVIKVTLAAMDTCGNERFTLTVALQLFLMAGASLNTGTD
jgi:hypothetical protein